MTNDENLTFCRGMNPDFVRRIWARRSGNEPVNKPVNKPSGAAGKRNRATRGTDKQIRVRAERAAAIKRAAKAALRDKHSCRLEAARILEDAKQEAAKILAVAKKRSNDCLVRGGLLDAKSAMEIIARVAAKHGVTIDEITGGGRGVEIVAIRHEAMAQVYVGIPHLSAVKIGRIFGYRDHTTVLHVVHKMGAHRNLVKLKEAAA